MKIFFCILSGLIIYTMIGYPIILELLNKLLKHKKINSSLSYEPIVSIIVAAHNEEAVIENKIKNLLSINYSKSKLEIIISSDDSNDLTNSIVETYQKIHPELIFLHRVKKRKGKTNAQDEAVNIAKGEILVFTDANSMLKSDSVHELVLTMSDDSVGYVSGQLKYTNKEASITSESEASYWDIDLRMRKIESNLSSITAGNGSLYAVRRRDYIEIDPVYSHDSIFPTKYVLLNKRAVYNEDAIAFEKAGETDSDEFGRKVRMSRKIITINFVDILKYNFFEYGLFSFFYFSHRTLRNNLYLLHILVFALNVLIVMKQATYLYLLLLFFQVLIYSIYFFGKNSKNKYIKFISYYVMTIFAQLIGAFREITGKSKPFWEKAETAR